MINLLILSRRRETPKPSAIVLGAVLPDAVMMVFYAWQLLAGRSESLIWSVDYYQPGWQLLFDLSHSIPLAMLGIFLCWINHQRWLLLLFASLLLHALGDLPLHHEDAHRHFLPVSDWRFISPLSYWNPDHYGNWVGLVEALVVLGAGSYLYFKQARLRLWIGGIGLAYFGYLVYVAIVWA